MTDPQTKLQEFEKMYKESQEDQNALSQIYKSINYKISPPNQQQLTVEEVKQSLRPNKQLDLNIRIGGDDINTYTEEEINKIILKQTYILNSGLFDLQQVFPKIEVKSLDDEEFDQKILTMLNQNRFN